MRWHGPADLAENANGGVDIFESLVFGLPSDGALRVESLSFAALFRLSQPLKNAKLLRLLLAMIETESLSLEIVFFKSKPTFHFASLSSSQFPYRHSLISRLLNLDNIRRIILFGPKEQCANCQEISKVREKTSNPKQEASIS